MFARTRNRAEDFAKALNDDGYQAESIHSDKSVGARRRALDKFRRGKANILVATDVLARGIDVPSVDYVINLDLPDCPEDYVHRIGRTGRAGEHGYAISFVSPNQRRLLVDIEKLIDRDIPFMGLETYDLDPDLLNRKNKRVAAVRAATALVASAMDAGLASSPTVLSVVRRSSAIASAAAAGAMSSRAAAGAAARAATSATRAAGAAKAASAATRRASAASRIARASRRATRVPRRPLPSATRSAPPT